MNRYWCKYCENELSGEPDRQWWRSVETDTGSDGPLYCPSPDSPITNGNPSNNAVWMSKSKSRRETEMRNWREAERLLGGDHEPMTALELLMRGTDDA